MPPRDSRATPEYLLTGRMTVSSTYATSGPYIGNGATTAFPFSFAISNAEAITVYIDGVPVFEGLYTVTLNTPGATAPTPSAGTVTFDDPPENGVSIEIHSNPSFLQDIDLQNNGAFLPDTFDEAHDRSAIRDLRMKWMLD